MGKITLIVEGMSCNHCKLSVEKALMELDGVDDAWVNLEKKEVVVSGSVTREHLAKVIEESGYDVIG